MPLEILHLAGLTPISVLSIRRKPPPSPRAESAPKLHNSTFRPTLDKSILISRGFHGSLVLLSSIFGGRISRALTYEEALQQSSSDIDTDGSISDFDIGGFLDGLVNFGVGNPLVVAGGVAILLLILVLSRIFNNPKPWGVEFAMASYERLGEDENSQLLDIREDRKVGSPDIGGLKKKVVALAYRGDDKLGFLNKLALKFKEPEKITLFILDKFDGSSELVAELVTANGFKSAYAIKDGAEGDRGWMKSGLPWIQPKQGFDFGKLSDAITDLLGESSDALPVTAGIAAAAGFGILAFTEVDIILQLLGSAALIQFVSKKLLFAEDRKVTLQQLDEFLNTQIAPKELVGEIQEIGKALLPSAVNVNGSGKALPAPSASNPMLEINSVPIDDSHSTFSTPSLSPFPRYPDLKPPTSPTPSQP